ncbi:hypothetical protein C8R45DRAFT_1107439 [Mycena sanguinolenta]|nr:hypothetical protein C8R45DRAFT_1107439 [Mycena sanguinolenta]
MAYPLAHGWTPSEDKALKLEAMRLGDQPATGELKMWIQFYRQPVSGADIHEEKRAALRSRVAARKAGRDSPENSTASDVAVISRAETRAVHEQRRAALYARISARKVAHDTLTDLRKHAIASASRKWPRPRCHPLHEDNLRRIAAQLRAQQERRAAAEASLRAAADARVAHLMELRANGRHIQK